MTVPQLPSAADRRRRRRIGAALIGIGLIVFTLFTFLTVRAITKPGAKVALGDDTFRVGEAEPLARRIVSDDYPLLFQDLRDKSIDLFVHHDRARPADEGWRAFEAHAPGAPRRCQLRYDRAARDFADPCTGARYPGTGAGLRSFKVVVSNGIVIVDLRSPGNMGG